MSEAAQTFSESWYRIANQRLGLRPNVKVTRQNFRGERWIVLENPYSNQFFRLRPVAYEFVARLRPDKTVQEVWNECLEKFPDEAPGQEAVIKLLSQLYYSNLLQYEQGSDAARLFERHEKTKQRQTRARLLYIMFMRFPLLDPDRFLVKTLPVVGKLISPFGALLWLGVVGLAIKVVLDNWGQAMQQSEGVLAPDNLFLLYAGLVLVKTLHEFGHAYFCRKFGGEVHVMGILLMIFTPMPYMDATSSWSFRQRWKRILVGLAGMIVELFVAAIAVFVWANTGEGTLHSLAYNIMFVASVSTIIFNLNPLLRYDGYYILSDILQIPNLYQRSLKQLGYWVERYAFGLKKAESQAHSRKEAFWLTTYAIASGIYRIFVFSAILLFVADRFLLLGLIMAGICLVSWVIVPVVKLFKYLGGSPRLDRQRPRAIAVTCGVFATLILLLQVVPFPSHFRAPGVVKSQVWREVVNEAPGRVAELVAEPGARVAAGDPLVRLENHELTLQLAAARASVAESQSRLRQSMQENAANLKPLRSQLESATKRLERLEKDVAALTIRAHQDGLWVAPDMDDFVSRWLGRGTSLGLVLDPENFEFAATVAQEDGDRLFAEQLPGAEVRLYGEAGRGVPVRALRVIEGEQRRLPSAALGWASGGDVAVSSEDPEGRTATEPFFEVRAELAATGGLALLHGRAGKIRFDLAPEPLLPRWIRRLQQLLQKRYQL